MVGRTEPVASVVIPARNAAAVLSRQLAALAAQDFDRSWEVVVADNGSKDATASLVRAAASSFPVPLRVVDASARRGANTARNEGVRRTSGDAVLFCDSDDVVGPSWVRALVDALDVGHTAGGPLEYGRLNPPELRGRGLAVPSSIQEHRGFRYALTANFAVRREVFSTVGLFDERFIVGFDEVDFGYRVHAAGLSLVEAPDAVVHYRLRVGRRALVRQRYGYGVGSARFREKFPELHDPALDPLPARLATVAKQAVRLGLSVFAGPEERDQRLGTLVYEVGGLGIMRRGRRDVAATDDAGRRATGAPHA